MATCIAGASLGGSGRVVVAAPDGQLNVQAGQWGSGDEVGISRIIDSRGGPMNWLSGVIVGTWSNLGTLHIRGTGPKMFLNGSFTKTEGLTVWEGGDLVTFYNPPERRDTITNGPQAVFEVRGDNVFRNGGTGPLTFVNAGTFRKVGGSGTTRFEPYIYGLTFNNTGTVEVLTGTLQLDSSVTLAGGSRIIGPRPTLISGTATVSGPAIVGNIDLAGGRLVGPGNLIITGTLNCTRGASLSGSGTVVVAAPNGQLNVQAGQWGSGNEVGISQTIDSRGGPMHWLSGAITGTWSNLGTLHIRGAGPKMFLNGSFTKTEGLTVWEDGNLETFYNPPERRDTITNGPRAVFEVRGDNVFRNGGTGPLTFVNAGTFRKVGGTGTTRFEPYIYGLTFNNTGTVIVTSGTLSLDGRVAQVAGNALTGGTWNVLAGSTLTFPSESDLTTNRADISLSGPGSNFINLGRLASNTGSLIVTDGRSFTTPVTLSNSGFLFVGSGSTLAVPGNYTQPEGGITYLADGTLTAGTVDIGLGSYLIGSGVVNGNLRNAGWIDVGDWGAAGYLVINGDYTQTADGILHLELGSFANGVYDQMFISGTAALGGLFWIEALPDFDAADGDGFAVLSYGARDASDPVVFLPDLGPDFYLDPVFDDVSLILWMRHV